MTHTSLQPHLTWGRKGGPCRPPLNKNPRGKVTAAPHHAPHGGGDHLSPGERGCSPVPQEEGLPGELKGGPTAPAGVTPPTKGTPRRRLTRSSSTGVSMAAAPCLLKQVTTAARSRSRRATWAGGWSRVPWPGTESGR